MDAGVGLDTMEGHGQAWAWVGPGWVGLAWLGRAGSGVVGGWVGTVEVWRRKRHGSMEGSTAEMLVLTQECTTRQTGLGVMDAWRHNKT